MKLALAVAYLALSPCLQADAGRGYRFEVGFETPAQGPEGSATREAAGILGERLRRLGFEAARVEPSDGGTLRIDVPGCDAAQLDLVRTTLLAVGGLEFRIVAQPAELEAAGVDLAAEERLRSDPAYLGPRQKGFAWLRSEDRSSVGEPGLYVRLAELDSFDESALRSARVEPAFPGGFAVSVKFTDEQSARFAEVTERNVGRRLAIIIDGALHSAPRIKEKLSGGAMIEGGKDAFSEDEARRLVALLSSRRLPAVPVLRRMEPLGPAAPK